MKLILGNISFEGKDKATIHEVYGILYCSTQKEAEELSEELCNLFLAYIIPDIWAGEIVYECDPNTPTAQ